MHGPMGDMLRRLGGLGAGLMCGLALVTCDQEVTLPSDGLLPLGTWGGDNSGVIVTEEQMHVHVGCTFGDIPGRVTLDANGRFTLDGTYVLRAYPIMVGPELPAQFSGRLNGKVLTLAIAGQRHGGEEDRRARALFPWCTADPRDGALPDLRGAEEDPGRRSIPIRSPAAESLMRASSLRNRVSSCLALIT